ncbi:hydroxyphenylacetyl-CoA thioesterase PaaI [Arhodomonas sp. AD133]|uniref:hydroxyphenylacetyl-CoA thioesterase PaaI n=1 Tax=Arhodomonas sp. AD133 TaxID=3415009 RepID=UPI003EBDF713
MSEQTVERLSPQALAERCAQAMWDDDLASQGLGMELVAIRPGYARLTMPVRSDMVNGHDNCHGGFIFTLADSAFAFACNYTNQVTVAQGASIDYLAPAKRGDVLIATGEECKRGGRTGVYDIRVENQDGRVIALFRGKSYQTKAQLVPGLEVSDD